LSVPDAALSERAELRARLFLRAVVPLLETICATSPSHAAPFASLTSQVRFRRRDNGDCATLKFSAGRLHVSNDVANAHAPEVDVAFNDAHALNKFFAGNLVLPSVTGLSHARLIAKVLKLLLALQVLKPGPPPKEPVAQALRVTAVLHLLARSLVELHRGGHSAMQDLVRISPERVYQWSVGGQDIGVWLRMHEGRIAGGRGIYRQREPFVHFYFRDVQAALSAFGAGEQMSGVRDGSVRTFGCPEYSRKLALMMQLVDQLLIEG
jgi:hypothetical protein